MARDYITVGDLVGKLEWYVIECRKCGRSGRFLVQRMLDQHGPDYSLIAFKDELVKDCPRTIAKRYDDRCGACSPGLGTAVYGDLDERLRRHGF